jgi:hypothetical protein
MVKVKCWGEAGDGARELLPWTANPGVQKNFDPDHRGWSPLWRLSQHSA